MSQQTTLPYQWHKELTANQIIYEFETNQGVRYQAYFSDYAYMFGSHSLDCKMYSFDLTVVGDSEPPKFTPIDPRIGYTVQSCFIEIFDSIKNVVIAVYDSLDGREEARYRKFSSWFDNAPVNYIERVNFRVPSEDYLLLTSVFLHESNSDKEAILDRYQQVLENGNTPLD